MCTLINASFASQVDWRIIAHRSTSPLRFTLCHSCVRRLSLPKFWRLSSLQSKMKNGVGWGGVGGVKRLAPAEQWTTGRENTDLPYGDNSQGHSLSHIITQHFHESEKSDVTFGRYFYTAFNLCQEGLKKAEKAIHQSGYALIALENNSCCLLIVTLCPPLPRQCKTTQENNNIYFYICGVHVASMSSAVTHQSWSDRHC